MNKKEQYSINAEAMVRALENTDVRMFMYFPETKIITVPAKTCVAYKCKSVYENMPHSFADDFVHEEDYDVFKEMYYKIDRGEKTATAIFHSKDLNYCNHVTLTTVSWLEDGSPNEVLGIIEDLSDTYKSKKLVEQLQNTLSQEEQDESVQNAVNLIANSISSSYLTIYHIWLEDMTYVCFQDETTNYAQAIGKRIPVDVNHLKMYIDEWVETKYQDALQTFFDFDTLAERLNEVNHVEYVYCRKKFGWTKAQYIAAKRDVDGNVTNIIFTVRDINNEVEQEEKKKKAIFELQHDPLTNAYNRKAFDEMTKKLMDNPKPIVFAMVDIDEFKMLNDTYGHDVGDQVLQHLVDNFIDTFRNEDWIFRLGGDEFAIILNDCTSDIWKSFCCKQEFLHRNLHEHFPQTKEITVSIGMCYSEQGYYEELFKLADEALYQTKNNGRSGCTLIDANHTVLKQWRDERFTLQTETALDRSTTGVYRMEFPNNTTEKPRMFCNETTKMILGVKTNATPEQCYAAWIAGIEPSYYEALEETKQAMVNEGQAECTYLWNHPVWGSIHVRSGGFGIEENGVKILQGYHHALKNTKIIEKQDDSKLLFNALSDVYFASYYLDLDKQTYATFKVAPGEESIQMQDKSIAEIFEEFIQVLVSTTDQEKMKVFVDMETLQQRIGTNKHIDCEYRSRKIKGWCRARFIPVKYNAQGKLTHVLFAIAALDSAMAKELDVSDYSQRSLAALFNNVPGGIAMFEWDGYCLKTLYVSEAYEKQYGESLISTEGTNPGGPDFKRVHPDDLFQYEQVIQKALEETYFLHHIYRIWSKEANRYLWTRIDATVSVQTEGNSLLYAIFTDITEQKDAELNIEKKQASLEAALSVSDQLCCEYDPQTHIIECLTEDNFLHLPKIVYNYPESMREYDFIHPEDLELFMETACSVDGSNQAHCDIRCIRDGEYRWFNCMFSPYFDVEKGRNIAILTMYDITLRMDAMNSYEERLRSLLVAKEDTLSMCMINVTQDTYQMVNTEKVMTQFVDETKNFETVMLGIADNIVGEESKKKYKELFNREHLLEQAANGQMHVHLEYMVRIAENHYEWIMAAVDMIQNPVTGDIGGVAYSKSTQKERMSLGLLDQTLRQDYIFAAVIMKDTDEFYLYNAENGEFSDRMENYWKVAVTDVKPICSKEDLERIQHFITKKHVIKHLDSDAQYSFSYNGMFQNEMCRLEIKFSYLDASHTMLLASMRNITDMMLFDKFRHDSQHDPLTDLYNRKNVFHKCRELLKAYPEEKFVMVHIDMKHFRLYNTFFGDEAGDQLLCDVADLLRWMDQDYEYWVYGRIEADVFCAFFPYNEKIYRKHIAKSLQYLKEYRSDFLIEPKLGIYFVTDTEMSVEAMFTRATLAAKEVLPSTPNATVIYNEKLEKELNETQQVINEMQLAIDREQFEVYLQPKYSLRTNKMIGAEALVRWMHPTKGMISPGMFIPVFESNGFITSLDRYMWEHVCQLISKWKSEGKPLVPISVNVSRLSMFGTSTVEFLKELVKKYDIEPKYLELELTESAYIDDPDEMMVQMNALRDAGFTILLDDFGSGYSSLNALRELPVDVLKLDMKFLSLDSRDLRGGLVISSIVRMSKLLDLVIIAEGVELQEQADFLKGIGCEYVQGYLFARPMPVKEYENILMNGEEPLAHVNKPVIGHIGRIIAEADSGTYAMGTVIPVALAFLEYSNQEFVFLRVNPAFYTEFNLAEDVQPVSTVFKKNMTKKNYDTFIQALEESIQIGGKRVPLVWEEKDGLQKKYVCQISYEGNIGAAATMVVVFTNITEEMDAF